MIYDNRGLGVSIADKAEIYAREIKQKIKSHKNIDVILYDSSSVGTEFIEYRQTVRTGGPFSTISPWEHDIVTVLVDAELAQGIVVMHDPHYRGIIRETVSMLNQRYKEDFPITYNRRMSQEYYFNRS